MYEQLADRLNSVDRVTFISLVASEPDLVVRAEQNKPGAFNILNRMWLSKRALYFKVHGIRKTL